MIANGHGRPLNFGKLYKCSNNDHLIFSFSVQRTPDTKKLYPHTARPAKEEFSSCDFPNNAKIIYVVIFHWLAGVLSWNQVPWHHQFLAMWKPGQKRMTGQPLIRRPQKYFRPLNKGFVRRLMRIWYKAEVKSQRLWKISYSARSQTYDTTQMRSIIRNKWRPNSLIPLVMFWLIWWTKRTLLKNSPYCSFYQRRWSLLFSMLYSFCKIIRHCK